jgi:hypothetical protein
MSSVKPFSIGYLLAIYPLLVSQEFWKVRLTNISSHTLPTKQHSDGNPSLSLERRKKGGGCVFLSRFNLKNLAADRCLAGTTAIRNGMQAESCPLLPDGIIRGRQDIPHLSAPFPGTELAAPPLDGTVCQWTIVFSCFNVRPSG